MAAGAEVESIYRPISQEGEGGCLIDRIAEEESENEKMLDRMILKEVLHDLKPQERRIIVERYYENKTQTAIASGLGISQVQVSRMEKKILKELRAKLTGKN